MKKTDVLDMPFTEISEREKELVKAWVAANKKAERGKVAIKAEQAARCELVGLLRKKKHLGLHLVRVGGKCCLVNSKYRERIKVDDGDGVSALLAYRRTPKRIKNVFVPSYKVDMKAFNALKMADKCSIRCFIKDGKPTPEFELEKLEK